MIKLSVLTGHSTTLYYTHTIEMAKLLLDHGADLHTKLDGKWGHTTPLRWSASHRVRLVTCCVSCSIKLASK